MRLLAGFAVLCIGGVAVLVASPPAPKPAPKPVVRVMVQHRTVTKRLPRRTRIKHVYVNAPAPAPAPVAPRPAVYVPPATAPAVPAHTPVTYQRPAPQREAEHSDGGSVHQWEEIHHRDAPNHDQAEHGGGDD